MARVLLGGTSLWTVYFFTVFFEDVPAKAMSPEPAKTRPEPPAHRLR